MSVAIATDSLEHLRPAERRCVEHYLSILQLGLGERLNEVWLFGSFARGDMWLPHMPMNSDIDLLVVTSTEIDDSRRERLLNDTYPLYLECGRQISPQFWSAWKFANPTADTAAEFKRRLLAEGRLVFRSR